jgi:hypothetical protein
LFVVPWLLHRHRKLWHKPDHFLPKRFLPGGTPPSKYAYIPFSIGPRVCTGAAFGEIEAILCLATIAQTFSLRLKEGYEVRPVARLTLRPERGLPMTLHRRTLTVRRGRDLPAPATQPIADISLLSTRVPAEVSSAQGFMIRDAQSLFRSVKTA